MKEIKLVIIGGGSSYTPELFSGLVARWRAGEFLAREVFLVDIPEGRERAEAVAGFLRRMAAKAGMPVELELSTDRRQALDGASFVVSQIRAGGMKARRADEHLPLKYGIIGQETTGPGGFANALRTIPVALAIAADIQEKCPRAWLLNFSNPSGVVTEALLKHTDVRAFGLCNVPISLRMAIARLLGAEPSRIRVNVAGLNHLSFITGVYMDGEDVKDLVFSPTSVNLLAEAMRLRPEVARLIAGLRVVPSPYLQYYWLRRRRVSEEQEDLASKGTRADEVMRIEEELFAQYRNPEVSDLPEALQKRGGAWYSAVALDCISAMVRNAPHLEALNVTNRGAIKDLPEDAVVEVTSVVDATGPTPLAAGSLPVEVRGLVQQVKAYEELTVEAAVRGDPELAFFALLNHPLVGDAEVALELMRDILESNREFLPQFQGRALK